MDITKLRNIFSTRIRKLREGKYNQGEFADSIGVSRAAMSYYEQKERTPDIGVLRSICEKHNVSADYLLGLMADENHTVSDVCNETGLSPKSAKVLKAVKPKTNEQEDSAPVPYDPDIDFLYSLVFNWLSKATDEEGLSLCRKVGPVTELLNVLLENEEGIQLLTLLSAIILGVNAGDDKGDEILVSINSNAGSEMLLPISIKDLSSSLWVNIQYFAHSLRDKQNPEPEEIGWKDDGKVVDYTYLLNKDELNSESNAPLKTPITQGDNLQPSEEV